VNTNYLATTHQNIIWFYVSVKDIDLLQQTKCLKQLLAIGSNSFDVEADIFSILFEDFTKVHGQRFENQAQMLLVEKVAE
jgi:hypothetical protein